MYNLADDNSLSATEKTVVGLKNPLQSESKVIIKWFKSNTIDSQPRETVSNPIRQTGT